MMLDYKTTVERLKNNDNILILSHRRPDGDTTGSAFGLYYALKAIGKRARILCGDPFAEKFEYFMKDYQDEDFTPDYIVAVDVADTALLGDLEPDYGKKIDLCIDHHLSNKMYGKETLLDLTGSSCAEMIYLIVKDIAPVTSIIADAIFTGITTDTGCFRFVNVTPQTHRVAAELMEAGANSGEINRINFESTSKARLQVEAMARVNMEYYKDDSIALLYLPSNIEEKYGVTEEDLGGITSLPRIIEGVCVGLTIKDRGDSEFRISVRTHDPYNASEICQKFGGGGHPRAAGCTMNGEIADVKKRLLDAVVETMNREDNV